MRVLTLVLLAAVAAALVASTALAAPGKRLGEGADGGLVQAYAEGRALQPKALLIRVTASPNEPVEVRWDTSCSRQAKGKVRDGEYVVTGPDLVRVKKGFKRPTDCLISVLAAYQNPAQEGTIRIELFARGKRARRG